MATYKPLTSGHLPVSDGNKIYWEASGNPKGKPALYLHGGPGSGIKSGYRKHFDPQKFYVVSFEQRGCGRSSPLVTDPTADLSTNTTSALIADIERLREYLKIESWLLFGASWGTTLALAYAQTYPDHVTEIVLGAVTTTSSSEVNWITQDMKRIFPQQWSQFASAVDYKPGQRLIDSYYHRITHPEMMVREATAKAWCNWEDVHVSLDPMHKPSPHFRDLKFCLLFATLVIHYWSHAGFLEENQIFDRLDRIAHIPAVLIHGRMDISSPLEIAWNIHNNWPNSELVVVKDEGHGGPKMANEVTRAVSQFSIV